MFTIATFRSSFPEFADTVKYPDGQITFWSTLAIAQVNCFLWGTETDLGVMLYTAHEITLAAQSQGAGVIGGTPGSQGVINSKTVGSVTVGYDTQETAERDGGFWNQTVYGRQILKTRTNFWGWVCSVMSKPTVTVTKDFTQAFNESIKRFKSGKVLVGIPAESKSREDGDAINNATLLAINNFGSPANNIPPRPVMEIGIRNAQDKIAEQFKLAVQNVLKKGTQVLETYYERAGSIAANSVKKVINDQEDIDGPAPATLRSRKSAGFNGSKSLVVTGQMRNAITYVVKKGI